MKNPKLLPRKKEWKALFRGRITLDKGDVKMNSLNSILLEGNVVRDAEMKTTPGGTSVCTFSIASNRFYRKNEDYEKETSFFVIEAWGKLAESCEKNCTKGRGIRAVGRLKQDRWTDSDGKSNSRIKVVAEHVEFRPIFKNQDGVSDESEDQGYDDIPFDPAR